MVETRQPEDFLPLRPAVLAILTALAGRELHGYAIMQEVAANTEGAVRVGPATLYRSVRQMCDRGWIEESERPDPNLDDERRRYYRLTEFGRRVAAAEVDRLQALVRTARARGLAPGLTAAPGTAWGEAS